MSATAAADTPPRLPARLAWAAAILLAVAGVAVTVWRPLAPVTGTAPVSLEQFDDAVTTAVHAYRTPRLVVATGLLLLRAAIPVALVAWPRSRRWLLTMAGDRDHAPWRGGLVASAVVVSTAVATAPAHLWLAHLHTRQWGFRTAGAATWARDWFLATVLEVLVVVVVTTLLLVLLRRGGRAWPAVATLIGTALTVVLVVVQPLVVEPLFLPTRPLQDPAVRASVQEVLDRAGVQADLLVGDASLRTTNVNAYVAGLGPTRRVVVFDTLLELPPDQVGAVVAHELAHREHGDIPRGVLLSATGLLAMMLALSWLLRQRPVVDLVGARSPSDPRLVPVIAAAVAVGTLLSLPVSNAVSRRQEAAADARALELTQDAGPLVRTFRTFVVRDLARPEPPWLQTLLFGTHPSADARIRAAVHRATDAGWPVPDLDEVRRDEATIRHERIGP